MSSFAIHNISDFVRKHINMGSTLLDIGAGRGLVAADLLKHGYQVTAIDASDQAVLLAAANNVTVIKATISTFSSTARFDAALLSMVAHHIHPLDQALDKLKTLLKPEGQVLLEDFAIEEADEPTAGWYYQTLAAIDAAELLDHPYRIDLKSALNDPVKAWWRYHSDDHHSFNEGNMIQKLMRERFEIIHSERRPYFYRYLASACTEKSGRDFGAKFYEVESDLIRANRIKPLGLRVIATAKNE